VAKQSGKSEKNREIPVADDWPKDLPITERELKLFEAHFLDIVTSMIQH
jgi:hypothetical protein